MNLSKNELIEQVKKLSNELDVQYNAELNFRNHCYLRIAYDTTVNDKWDAIIKRPFTKYATEVDLLKAITFLETYKKDKNVLIKDNNKSLSFRKKYLKEKSTDGYLLF